MILQATHLCLILSVRFAVFVRSDYGSDKVHRKAKSVMLKNIDLKFVLKSIKNWHVFKIG